MTDVLYIDIAGVTDDFFQRCLVKLPETMQNDVLRYKYAKDRKLKLFGRLLVANYFKKNSLPFSFENWQIDQNKKPFIPNGKRFNLSRSNEVVIAAFSDGEIGIDIEFTKQVDFDELISHFHIEEQQAFNETDEKMAAFYKIWTRKEAFLKAKGLGIIKGLSAENCLNDQLQEEGVDWYIRTIDFLPNYALALALNESNISNLSIQEIKIETLDV